jgi:FlaA1/EpsC-like NDP-sugar epimerase
MTLPDISHFIKTKITLRDESLFAKDLKTNDIKLRTEIESKRVLVIGGAGTIGSSFIRSLVDYNPSSLIVVDTNENGLTELTRKLRSDKMVSLPDTYLTYPMSFASETFDKILDKYDFDIVANFAAHKHVRSEKDIISIEAMIENNVFSAQSLLEKLSLNPPKHFFCVSTDKAANPVNVMGGSKKIMEKLIMSYSSDFKITTARFANVAFSNGSLLDGYLNRLMQRQPISCPSDVKRFFVSPDESGQICLLACILGKSGDIFFPKLCEDQMVNFKDITENFFEYLGIKIDYCISEKEAKEKSLINLRKNNPTLYPVYFFKTDTSGEKLYEEFYEEIDEVDLTTHRELGVITNSLKPKKEEVENDILKLKQVFQSNSSEKSSIVAALSSTITGFNHIETGKSLDQKM